MQKQLFCFLLILAAPAEAQVRTIPAVGECFDVQGKVYMSANSGVVLDTDSERYFLDSRNDCFPEIVQRPMTVDFLAVVWGRYGVCREPDDWNQFGAMHMVCIKSATVLSVSR
jgi:hypothetical protein